MSDKKVVVVKHKAAFSNTIFGKFVEMAVLTAGGTVALAIGTVAAEKIIEYAHKPKEVRKDEIDRFMNQAKKQFDNKIKR